MNLRQRYLEASDDLKKRIKVPFQVRKDKKSLESWLIDVESDVSDLEFKIEEAKGKESFDADGILDLIDELELKKRRFDQGEALLAELFSDGAPELEKKEE